MEVFKSIGNIISKPWFLLICPATIFLVIFFNTIKSEENCYYIKLNGLKFTNPADTITFGKDDNVIFNPEYIDNNFLKVAHTNNGYYWISKNAAYLKFNDSLNFNKHLLSDGDIINYKDHSINFQDLIKTISPYRYRNKYLLFGKTGQQYFSVSDLFQQEQTQSTENNSNFDEPKSKSLLFYNDGKCQIILLDTITTVLRKDSLIMAVKNGFVKTNSLKIEIINPKSTYFISKKEPLFKNRNINVSTVRTEWQSSHLLCKFDSSSQSTSVYYSQPLVIAFNKETINEVTDRTVSRTMQINQECTLMDKKTFYFEKFSNLFQSPIFNIQKADSAYKKDTIIFNTTGNHQNVVSKSIYINQSFDFEIDSHTNTNIKAFGNFVYISKWNLLLPFTILSLCFIVSILFLRFLTDENRFAYGNKLDKISNDSINSTDFENIDIPSNVSNKAFSRLRLPIFSLVFVLLVFKLVIATKLTFTHPFFPQLYFIGCFMAFTTPVFISYFFIRNSWAMPALNKSCIIWRIPTRILITSSLIVLIFLIYFITWHFIGSSFYESYFVAYGTKSSLSSGIISLIKMYIPFFESNSPLLKEKFYQIPLLILVIPILLLLFDLLSPPFLWFSKKCLRYLLILLNPIRPSFVNYINKLIVNNQKMGFNFFQYINVFFITLIILSFTKSTTILHFVIMLLLLWYFNSITTISVLLSERSFKLKPFLAKLKNKIANQWGYYLATFILLAILYLFKVRSDSGIIINYFLVVPFVFFLTIIMLFATQFENGRYKLFRKVILPILPITLTIVLIFGYSSWNKPQIGDLDRSTRRINSIINKDDALETGGKQYLSDIQFLEIAQINSFENTKSPSFKFINRQKPQHEFISKGLYPVIINDLNPIVFLDYGGWLFLLLLFCAWLVFYKNRQTIWNANFRLEATPFDKNEFNLVQLFRYVPALIIISNSLWLFLSLFNIVFFTGRNVNGFGVDSIADWFEMIAFAALMGSVIFSKPNNNKNS